MRPAALLLCVGLLAAGCGSDDNGDEAAPAPQATRDNVVTEYTPPDRELFESNVKYEALEALEARGASAPFLDETSCAFSSPTEAVCTTSGYDVDEANSQCGYELLPCGRFTVRIEVSCADAQGHECEIGMELEPVSG